MKTNIAKAINAAARVCMLKADTRTRVVQSKKSDPHRSRREWKRSENKTEKCDSCGKNAESQVVCDTEGRPFCNTACMENFHAWDGVEDVPPEYRD